MNGGSPMPSPRAEQAGRDPAMAELILGCPGALPNSGFDPRGAVEERIARGAGRLALPVTGSRNDAGPLRRGDHQALRERVESPKRIVVSTPLSCRPAVALSITVGASRVVLRSVQRHAVAAPAGRHVP